MLTKAVIFAAGEGKRMHPITEQIPKPLVPLWGRPMLHYALCNIHHHNLHSGKPRITDVYINLRYKAAILQEYLAELAMMNFNFTIHHTIEDENIETGGGLKNIAKEFCLSEEFILTINSDAVFLYNINFHNPISQLTDFFAEITGLAETKSESKTKSESEAENTAPADAHAHASADAHVTKNIATKISNILLVKYFKDVECDLLTEGDFFLNNSQLQKTALHNRNNDADSGNAYDSKDGGNGKDGGDVACDKPDYLYTGIGIVNLREVLCYNQDSFSLSKIFTQSEQQGKLYGTIAKARFLHIGTETGLKLANQSGQYQEKQEKL